MAIPFYEPAGTITWAIDRDTVERTDSGLQPMSSTLRIVCAANFGNAPAASVTTPAPCSVLRIDGRVCRLVARSDLDLGGGGAGRVPGEGRSHQRQQRGGGQQIFGDDSPAPLASSPRCREGP